VLHVLFALFWIVWLHNTAMMGINKSLYDLVWKTYQTNTSIVYIFILNKGRDNLELKHLRVLFMRKWSLSKTLHVKKYLRYFEEMTIINQC